MSVTITITQTPAPTTLNTAQTFCEIDNATIADIVTTETGVEWFATATSTTPLNATTPLLNGATYFGAITTNGCESATRLSVTITITQTPAPTTLNTAQTFCEIDNATIADIVTTETGVEWFATATSTTPLNATTPLVSGATYYGAITTNGCESATRLSVTITITQTPAPTTLNAAQTFCEIDNATIADIVTTETGVEWFATATSTTPLNATTPLVSGATYYGAITTNGCESATRLSVTITITETVAPTTTASSQTFCEIDQATVADLVVSGTGIQWYADATSTTALPSDTVLTNGTYYATQAAASCESATRLAVIVSITATVAPIGNATQTFCEITLPTVANLQATGTGVQWYADAASTTPLTAATPLTDGATYYATQTLNGCESLARLEVTVTITVTPAPTGNSPQAFCQSDNATLVDLQATGVGIQWYASATSTTPLALTSVLVDGATYYASQTLNGCESLLRLPITVIIDEAPTANAGADQVQYNSGTFVLAGNNPTVGTGTWTVVSGTATFNDPSLFNSAVTIPDNSTATLMWTVVNGTCTVSDEVIISYYIPELEILKSGVFMDTNGDGIDNVGDQIHYTFTVSNTGQTTINNIIVSDPLVAVTGGPISLSAGTSDATTFTAVYNVTQSDIDAGVVYNLATVNGQDPNGGPVTDTSVDPNPLNPSDPLFDPACPDCTVVPIVQEPNMTLTKEGTWQDTDGNGMASVGDTIIYAFTVTNTGNVTLSNISIADPLTGLVLSGGPIITLAPGLSDSTSITGIYAVTQADIEAGAVYNLATATGTDTNGNPISEVSVDPTPIDVNDPLFDPACPDCTVVLLPQVSQIAIIKTGVFNDDNQDNIAQIGETITYSFEVVNTGNMTLYNVTVSDPLPGVILTGGPIAELLPGQSDTTTFTATYIVTNQDLINGGVTNQALVSATNNAGAVVEDLSDDDSLSENDPTFVPLEGCTLEVFNAITPNEDGVNDTFYIAGIECYPKNKVIIFNRWGVQVYGVDGYNNNDKVFRGYSEGRTTIQQSAGLPVGTYFYVIEYVDFTGKGINKSGHLYIN
ncbi:gliding motility-associated C-terminal domain-containing protein [Flavobacterium qiangtangense]|uniref:Gliding motility-associated C-terminal domain-containing protein n=1 Tax=Flavobacterium qiangtangense TaxID=1442595 RepID=A0ABW1PU23_9FLAO